MEDRAFPVPAVLGEPPLPALLAEAIEAAADFASAANSDATHRAYASDFADFSVWCGSAGLTPLPARPETVSAYLAHLGRGGRHRASTIERRVAAIAFHHRQAGAEPVPTGAAVVRRVLSGIRHRLGTRPNKKAPLTADLVAKVLRKLPTDTLIGLRDRALILLAFAGAVRRSELVALDLEHIERRPQGVLLHIARSKGDQSGRGQIVAVPNGRKLKPVEALDAWIKAAVIKTGPVFCGVAKGGRLLPDRLCDRQVARIVKAAVKRIGLNADLFAGHSTRSGFATTAGSKNLVGTARQLRHAKVDTTMGYIQSENAFRDHAGEGIL